VKRSAGGFDVTFAGGTRSFDLVLSTVAIPELLRLAPDLPEETRRRWNAISYCHALCPILELDRSLSPYYWLNVGDDAMPFGGVIEHTNFLPPSDYGGRHVVYLSNYVLPDDPKWKKRDEELWAEYLPALKVVNPSFDESWILAKQIGRAEYAQPIIVPNYSKLLPPLQTPVPGLWSACMAQTYPEDRGQNYAIRIGREAADAILKSRR
jgi:protoporphyrinogen oxidase